MLRRGSKAKQQQQQQQAELERRESEAQMLPKQPPQLPSHQALPGMPSFGGDGNRPDSFAIFNNAYSHRSQPQPVNVRTTAPTQAAANFSRPGNVSMSSAHRDNSSSPAYALRGASASVSPPPVKAAVSNGDDLTERTASMTNRGRYDYTANSAQPGHVNSPRRMRRRKDPTPFKLVYPCAYSQKTTADLPKCTCCRHKEQRQEFVHIPFESLSRDAQLETRCRGPPTAEERQFQFHIP